MKAYQNERQLFVDDINKMRNDTENTLTFALDQSRAMKEVINDNDLMP